MMTLKSPHYQRRGTMQVSELKQLLEVIPDDYEVVIETNGGFQASITSSDVRVTQARPVLSLKTTWIP
jgi:hypothetical protein